MILPLLAVALLLPDATTPTEGLKARRVGSSIPPEGLELAATEYLPGGDTLTLEHFDRFLTGSRLLLTHIDAGGARTELGITQSANSQQASERILYVPAYTDTNGVTHEATVTVFDQVGTGNSREMSVAMFRLLVQSGGGLDQLTTA